MCIDFLENTIRLVVQNHILEDDNITGLRDREVRLSGDNHAERLKSRRDVDIVLRAVRKHLAKVLRTSV